MTTSSTARAKPRIFALLAAVLVLVGGCSSDMGESSQGVISTSTPGAKPTQHEPGAATSFTKVEQDKLADVNVKALTDTVAWDGVTEASRTPADPRYGERFAILAAHYLTDSRGHELTASQVDQLLDAPTTLHRYLIADHATQVDLETRRHIDPHVSPWIRSDVPENGASVVHTQLNAYTRASVNGQPADAWVRFRVDVQHDGTRWWLTGFNNALGSFEVELTERHKQLYFYSGEGWRRIPALK
ncbi:hypothetical protein ACFWQC_27810 [Nocardioides sp. NPDC058538]|uniref:hypothetical protein n=1 Tax=Nocardioides sp. NPDC058538 TaxID=3346542 RepID=UPI00365421B1